MTSPADPLDPAEAARRARAKLRAPFVLLAIAGILGGAGGQGIASGDGALAKLGFAGLGAAGVFAAAGAMLGRAETRRWLAGIAGANFTMIFAARWVMRRLDERVGAVMLGALVGSVVLWLVVRLLDPEWAKLADALQGKRRPAPKPSAPVPPEARKP